MVPQLWQMKRPLPWKLVPQTCPDVQIASINCNVPMTQPVVCCWASIQVSPRHPRSSNQAVSYAHFVHLRTLKLHISTPPDVDSVSGHSRVTLLLHHFCNNVSSNCAAKMNPRHHQRGPIAELHISTIGRRSWDQRRHASERGRHASSLKISPLPDHQQLWVFEEQFSAFPVHVAGFCVIFSAIAQRVPKYSSPMSCCHVTLCFPIPPPNP